LPRSASTTRPRRIRARRCALDRVARSALTASFPPPSSAASQDIDAAQAAKAAAQEAASNGNWQAAVDEYTKALSALPSALVFARRGDAFLRLKRPNAAILDADAALALNPDSAKAFVVRGKAHRLLGAWEAAAADLGTGQRIDFDLSVEAVLKIVLPKAKIVATRRAEAKARKAEAEAKERAAARAAAAAAAASASAQPSSGGFGGGGFPGMGGMGGGMGGVPPEMMQVRPVGTSLHL